MSAAPDRLRKAAGMPIAERRELLLRALLEVFKHRDFAVKDITKTGVWSPQLVEALEANFGKNFLKLKPNMVSIKIGRLLKTLPGTLFGHYDLRLTAAGDPRRYRVVGPDIGIDPGPAPIPYPGSPPKQRPVLTIETTDRDGRVHHEVLRDRNGEPLRDKSADAPIVDKPVEPGKSQPWKPAGAVAPGTGTPTVKSTVNYRQPTHAELVARHNGMQASGINGPSILRGADQNTNGEISTLWNRSLRNL